MPSTAPNIAISPTLRPGTVGLALIVAVWIAVCTAGLGWLANYSAQPGKRQTAGPLWPTETTLPRNPDGPTVVLFLHPECPCSGATLSELQRSLAHGTQDPLVLLVMCTPAGSDADTKSSLQARAKSMDLGTLVIDPDGRQAALFGARTSGHAYYFDQQGTLRFDGGITPARGHEGDCAGQHTLTHLLSGDSPPVCSTSVHGCALQGRSP